MKKIRLLLTQKQYKNVVDSITTAIMYESSFHEVSVDARRQYARYKRLLKLIEEKFDFQTKVLDKREVSKKISFVQHRKKP